MQALFKTWKTNRELYLKYFEQYSPEQLNKVPQGFNNNLIWNIGHIIVAQQGLVYKGSNQPLLIPETLFERYKGGTRPEGTVTTAEMLELKALLSSLVTQTEADYQQGIFRTYNERTTITGFHLGSVEDAFEFNNYHEGMHLGYMMALRKLV